ncbi:MAG: ABC transporter ATP-binding protein [Candidatus Hadarchaeaceae archaeon]
MVLIKLRNVTKIYESGATRVRALDNVSFDVEKGEFMSVMGPSGSGKTTLLNVIGCLDKPTSGKVRVGGRDVTRMSPAALDALRLQKIGFVFQMFNLIPTLTALENVELSLSIAGLSNSEQRDRAGKLLELVGLGTRLNHRPSQLSAGEKQRVAIARALANNPELVLADEPTGNLDTKIGNEIVNLMRGLNRKFNKTFIIVTHDEEVARVTDRIIQLKDGKVVRERRQKKAKFH